MRRPRFTLRALMISVAVVVVGPWGLVLWWRSEAFAAKAREHQFRLTRGTHCLSSLQIHGSFVLDGFTLDRAAGDASKRTLATAEQREARLLRGIVEYEKGMYDKHRRAARVPMLLVDPDPPPPPARYVWTIIGR